MSARLEAFTALLDRYATQRVLAHVAAGPGKRARHATAADYLRTEILGTFNALADELEQAGDPQGRATDGPPASCSPSFTPPERTGPGQ